MLSGSLLLCKTADSSLVSLQVYLSNFAFHTGLQMLNNDAQQL